MNGLEYNIKMLKLPKYYWVYILLFTVFFLPYLILGENSKINVHDNLDSNVAWAKMIIDNDLIFSSPNALIAQPLNGIPRSSIGGSYNFSLIVFSIFGMFWGYVFNKMLISILAFFGMFFLLKRYFLFEKESVIYAFGVACIYSFLPFWSFTATVAGLPLLVYAFLNIRNNRKNILNWIIFILFPFYSSLVLTGFFILIIFSSIFIYDFLKSRKEKWNELLGIFVISFFYIVSHLPLFYSLLFNKSYVSHREELLLNIYNFNGSLWQSIQLFFKGQGHSLGMQILIAFFALGWSVYLLKKKKFRSSFLAILTFIIITSAFYGFYYWSSFVPIREMLMDIIPIQLNRFYMLHPMLWYILFALLLNSLSVKFNKKIALSLMFIQFLYVISSHEILANRNGTSFKDFYASHKFKKVQNFIDKPVDSYRVISLGIHPAVLQYNGFYTLDGYSPNYPLSYKHQFRQIIEKELDKDPFLKDYFDNWGSRCYLYSSELGKLGSINIYNTYEIKNFEINTNVIKQLGGRYLISIVRIENSNMELLEKITSQGSYPEIFLYQVN